MGFHTGLVSGGGSRSKTTSIGASTGLSIVPLSANTELAKEKAKEKSPELDGADSEDERNNAVLQKTVEELEADVICGKLDLQLSGSPPNVLSSRACEV